jgi:hypothetical protein
MTGSPPGPLFARARKDVDQTTTAVSAFVPEVRRCRWARVPNPPGEWACWAPCWVRLQLVAALSTARHEKEDQPSVVKPAMPLGGPVAVLVGIDGSPECGMALQNVIALLGPRLGRLCLATVVPFDDVPAHRRQAVAELHRYARFERDRRRP